MENLFYYLKQELDGSGIDHDPHTGELLTMEGSFWRVVEIRVKQGKRHVYCTVPICTPEN